PVFWTTLALGCLGGLGTTIVYHRSLAHRALRLNPWVEQFLIFWAVFNGGGAPRQWVANHRKHHAKSDTEEDVSSPRWAGCRGSHRAWLSQMPDPDPSRWNPDMKLKRYDVWTILQPLMLTVSVFGGWFLFGWRGLFWIGAVRLVYVMHAQFVVNSVL